VGIPSDWIIWILMFDQVLFIVMDIALGLMADRVMRLYGRLALPILVVTAVSCVAFLLIPFATPLAASGVPAVSIVLFVLIFIWSATSSALRAPPWVLLGKYAATPSVPWLAALSLVGLSVANAIAPYLGATLRNVDPRLPFVVSSLTLVAVTSGLIWVERSLARSAPPADAAPAPVAAAAGEGVAAASGAPALGPGRAAALVPVLIGAAGILTVGFQVHSSFNVGSQYLRFAQQSDLEFLLPIFWIGFNLASFPAARLAARAGDLPVMAWAGAVGAIGTAVAALAPNLPLTILAQLVAGGAWGAVLTGGLAAAVGLGRPEKEGRTLGFWFAIQAAATVIRMALVAVEVNKLPGFPAAAAWAAPVLWLTGAAVLAAGIARAYSLRTARAARA
jgi:hypothetical protein